MPEISRPALTIHPILLYKGGLFLGSGVFVAFESSSSDGRSHWHRKLAVAVILFVTLLRILYLFFLCPYDLAPDEGHYWDWSRHLDWSYYSKGPLIAWIIRAGCEMFGSTALSIHGTLMPAVRLPAVLFGSGLLTALYILTYQSYRSDRLALGVVLIAITLPPISVSSIIMTIDSPFLCLWAWAVVVGRWAIVEGKQWAWPVAGFIVALGILAKYTMGLWLVSAGLFMLFTPEYRRLLFRPGFWVMVATAGLSALPVLYWNSEHDWVTFRHVAVQAGVVESKKNTGFRWYGPLEFAAGQAGVLLGFWFICLIAALIRYRPWGRTPVSARFLWWMCLPTFAVFGVSSFKANGQINWPAAGYVSGAVLVAGWISEMLQSPNRPTRRLVGWGMAGTVAIGAIATLLAHDTQIPLSFVGTNLAAETLDNPTPIRTLDPAARLKGSRFLGSELDEIRRAIRNTEGQDPVLVGFRWDQPGLLGFYTKGQPQAYTIGLFLGIDRHSQYEFWHPNPIDDAQEFQGRTFLIVGGGDPRITIAHAFDSIDEPKRVVYRENGHAVSWWIAYTCRGFKGFDPKKRSGGPAEH